MPANDPRVHVASIGSLLAALAHNGALAPTVAARAMSANRQLSRYIVAHGCFDDTCVLGVRSGCVFMLDRT